MTDTEFSLLSAQQIKVALQRAIEVQPVRLKAVCFDFFDTLVERSVIPEDTKKIAANQLAELLVEKVPSRAVVDGKMIYQLRRVLEQRLCSDNLNAGADLEFNLIHLAFRLHQVLQAMVGLDVLPPEETFVAIFLDIELAVEKRVQTVNEEVFGILRYCRDCGLATAIVSDFYLPSGYFRQLVEFHGLSAFVDRLFISADYSVTKGHSGRLYEIVNKELGFAPEEMAMIGDNTHADARMARARGLIGYCLRRKPKGSGMQSRKGSADRLEKEFSAIFSAKRNGYFPEMSLSLFYFVHNLFLQAIRDRQDTLFFCSKEGEFLRKLFMRYQEIRFGRQVVASRYLIVSRKATFICSCKPLEEEDFGRLFTYYRDISLLEFLQSLNFSESQSLALCEELRLEPKLRRSNLKDHPDFKALIDSTLFRTAYEKHRQRQKENFLRYLESYQRDLPKDGLALVDVGWKGSIQNNIFYALDGRVNIIGYYIGLLSPSEILADNSKRGLLFSDVPTHSPFIHVFNNNRSLFEMVLGASHGSADGYFGPEELKDPAFTRSSSTYHSGTESRPYVTVLDLPEERKLYKEQILPLQSGYFQMLEELTEAMVSCRDGSVPELSWFARHHARMSFRPTRKEVDFFAQLYHLENYGLFEFTSFADLGKVPIRHRMENFVRLWKNPAGMLETGIWPPIILRRLGLSWLQPLDGIKRHRRIFGEQG